jgi:hypothetical protein
MLRKARSCPSRLRTTSTLSRPTWTFRNFPGVGRSADRTAQNHMVSKIRVCSREKTAGSV